MKKITLALLLVLVLLAGGIVAYAEPTSDTGIWERRAYVDEFDLPTDEYYISNREPIVGKFSNSATTDSLLTAWLYVDDYMENFTNYYIVSIKLIEYGNHTVKNSYSREQYYDVVMMDPDGDKYYFDGYMESGREVITFDKDSSKIIINALCGNGTVRFAISEKDNATTKYILTIDDTTGILEMFPYTGIGTFSEGLVPVRKQTKEGFVDINGNQVIPFEYNVAFSFSDGLAQVAKKGKYGFIDVEGNVVVPLEYSNTDIYDFSEGLARVRKDNKWGFIDTSGNLVIPYEYDDARGFNEGFAAVKKNGNWGFIDTVGNLVIPCEYSHVLSFFDGFAAVCKNGQYGYIDTKGNLIIPHKYDNAYSFADGLAPVAKSDGPFSEKWGFIDTTGNLVIPYEHDDARSFREGLAPVEKDEKWGYIDTSGNLVISYEYSYAGYFNEGLASVICYRCGYIDTTGKTIIPFEYNTANYGEGYFTLLKDGEISIISRDEVQPNWEEELATREQTLAEQAEARRIEAEKQKMLKEYTDKDTIKAAQTALNEAGYDCGKPDGIAGKGTAGAITNYQTDKGLNITGTVTHELLISLGVIAE